MIVPFIALTNTVVQSLTVRVLKKQIYLFIIYLSHILILETHSSMQGTLMRAVLFALL